MGIKRMKRLQRRIPFAFVFMGFATIFTPGLAQSTVNGVVIDITGSEVPNASIQAMSRNADDSGTVGSLLGGWIQADSHGRFSVSLPPGRYKIVGKAEADGYPNPVFALCADLEAQFPTISLGRANISGVRVVLGGKGGILEGEVHDKARRLPIQKTKITLTDAQNAKAYVEIFTNDEGRFQFTVPSKAIVISAIATGYHSTQFNEGKALTLSGNEHRTVVVELNRR